MVKILKAMGLMQFISSNVPSPASGSAHFALWEQEDCYVSACINATLHQSIAHLAIGTTSAEQLWKILEENYYEKVYAKRAQIRTQFSRMK